MIGLGSNRLTVCRRGGMSVTQAGKGGMEWLAGGRGPIWASPYSAQATAALKAQFSLEQWATIRDYGFSHPEIVGYMNAYAPEDAKIAYSLVEGIGSRYTYSDGVAFCIFDYVGNANTEISGKGRIRNSQLWFADSRTGTNNICCVYSGTSFYMGHGGNREVTGFSYADGTVCNIVMNKNGASVNGISCSVGRGSDYTNSKLNNGKYYPSGMTYYNDTAELVASENGTEKLHVVPFIRNNQVGYIDLVNDKFYGNANSSGSLYEDIVLPN